MSFGTREICYPGPINSIGMDWENIDEPSQEERQDRAERLGDFLYDEMIDDQLLQEARKCKN